MKIETTIHFVFKTKRPNKSAFLHSKNPALHRAFFILDRIKLLQITVRCSVAKEQWRCKNSLRQ